MDIMEEWRKISDLEDEIDNVKESISKYLSPLAKESGIGDISGWSIEAIDDYGTFISVETARWTSGGKYDYNVRIPRSILESSDPMKAAKLFAENAEREKKEVDRSRILAEIERLKKSLEN